MNLISFATGPCAKTAPSIKALPIRPVQPTIPIFIFVHQFSYIDLYSKLTACRLMIVPSLKPFLQQPNGRRLDIYAHFYILKMQGYFLK